MHILDTIVDYKRQEVAKEQSEITADDLKKSVLFQRETVSMQAAILDESKLGVIAEFKRKSPSKPKINLEADVEIIVPGYEKAGASGISVLTDSSFFGGSDEDIILARQLVELPLLRKDFIIDPYQIIRAKAIGADVVLLIARILSNDELADFNAIAKDLGLEVLVEIHNQEELDKLNYLPDLVGVNNRNLDTFEVNYQNSIDLIQQLPNDAVKIAESGIMNTDIMVTLKEAGFDGFLIGEKFMATNKPGKSCHAFLKDYKSKL